ncbi:class II aldolase/adducin family protein [SAR202 cluster bacterium AD-802-E10_MRT_200m]|nr:class II aldolase/adducin family protein [SAR202 cluster bacterium AD-802-E10_MRT_200m]
MFDKWERHKKQVLLAAKELMRSKLVGSSSGNISKRIVGSGSLIAITPSRKPYRQMVKKDILIADEFGAVVEGELPVSSEIRIHLETYRMRKDVHAVIHSHSMYVGICSVAGFSIPPILDELVVLIGGEIKLANYAFPGSQELAENVCEALGDQNAVMMQNHGLLAVGRDLDEAFNVCEIVEKAAQTYVFARLLGQISELSPDVIAKEKQLYEAARKEWL